MNAIQSTGAQAVHPGYGFLSEKDAFFDRLEEAGVVFIGPGKKALQDMGDKIASKTIAREANVNTIPGFLGLVQTDEEVKKIGEWAGPWSINRPGL